MAGGIYIALGANLPSERFGAPRDTLERVLETLASKGLKILHRSSWWQSPAQPVSDQPDFVNGVAEIGTDMRPEALLNLLHAVEADFGRIRRERWGARVLDLDLIDYRGLCRGDAAPLLPHPRARDRLFVLLPLQEIAPGWRHPETGQGIENLIATASPMKINRLP